PYRGQSLTWLAVRTPELRVYANYPFQESASSAAYDEDITAHVHAAGAAIVALGLRRRENLLLFVGNTDDRALTTALRVTVDLSGSYRMRVYDSLVGSWADHGLVVAERLRRGIVLQLERKGFWVFEALQEV
ncbi:MAG TPA: hypothetical protein VHB98_10285, partial [Chloroflexota bacterium]|nr:hypothetical protein [Chloroflexota bacterium]